jgi:hypothetical protein
MIATTTSERFFSFFRQEVGMGIIAINRKVEKVRENGKQKSHFWPSGSHLQSAVRTQAMQDRKNFS